jgi:hypothetical protein
MPQTSWGLTGETEMTLGETLETFLTTNKFDDSDREIGFVIGLRDDTMNFYAWVQNTRRINGEWKEFGVRQRSKCFTSQEQATRWAYVEAGKRISRVLKTK